MAARTTESTLSAGTAEATLAASTEQLTAIKLERVAEQHSPFISLFCSQRAFDTAIPFRIERGTVFFRRLETQFASGRILLLEQLSDLRLLLFGDTESFDDFRVTQRGKTGNLKTNLTQSIELIGRQNLGELGAGFRLMGCGLITHFCHRGISLFLGGIFTEFGEDCAEVGLAGLHFFLQRGDLRLLFFGDRQFCPHFFATEKIEFATEKIEGHIAAAKSATTAAETATPLTSPPLAALSGLSHHRNRPHDHAQRHE